jgi:hypothetical protein
VPALRADLAKRPAGWLYRAAKAAAAEVVSDFNEYSP